MKPAPYLVLARQQSVPPNEVMYVGNNPRKDFVGTKPLGFRTVRTLRSDYAHLEADRRIHTLDELTEEFLESPFT